MPSCPLGASRLHTRARMPHSPAGAARAQGLRPQRHQPDARHPQQAPAALPVWGRRQPAHPARRAAQGPGGPVGGLRGLRSLRSLRSLLLRTPCCCVPHCPAGRRLARPPPPTPTPPRAPPSVRMSTLARTPRSAQLARRQLLRLGRPALHPGRGAQAQGGQRPRSRRPPPGSAPGPLPRRARAPRLYQADAHACSWREACDARPWLPASRTR
jgi:hypothetical protein